LFSQQHKLPVGVGAGSPPGVGEEQQRGQPVDFGFGWQQGARARARATAVALQLLVADHYDVELPGVLSHLGKHRRTAARRPRLLACR